MKYENSKCIKNTILISIVIFLFIAIFSLFYFQKPFQISNYIINNIGVSLMTFCIAYYYYDLTKFYDVKAEINELDKIVIFTTKSTGKEHSIDFKNLTYKVSAILRNIYLYEKDSNRKLAVFISDFKREAELANCLSRHITSR